MSKLMLNPEFNLYEKNGMAFCSSRQVARFEEALSSMEVAVHNSFLYPEKLYENLKLLESAEELLPNKFDYPFLRNACQESIMRNFLSTRISEKDIHIWFNKNLNLLLGEGWNIVKRKNHHKHIPDFWLENNNSYIPVEIKLHTFDPRHLEQLVRYINFYGCTEGLAIGRELNCALPNNIKFLKYDYNAVKETTES